MIKFKELRWSNAFSYGPNNRLNLCESPLVQLVGKNGYGKTSIALIIEEVLFNKNSKGTKKSAILNRYVKDKAYTIELDFSIDSDEYTVSTKRGSTQTVSLSMNGVDISSHTSTGTYKQIEDLLGWDHKKFTQIVNQSSASSLEFLTATDSNRKKFLIELLDLTQYITAGDHFKERAKELDNSLNIVKGKLSVVQSLINNTKVEQRKPVPDPIVVNTSEMRQEVARIEHTILNINEQNAIIVQNNKYKEILDGLKITPIGERPVDSTSTLLQTIAGHQAIIASSNKIINKFSSLKGCCPTCDSQVDEVKVKTILDEQRAIVSTLEAEIKILNSEVKSIREVISKWEALKKVNDEYEKYHSLYDPTKSSALLDKDDLNSKRRYILTEIHKLEAEAEARQQEISSAKAWNAKVDALEEQLQKAVVQRKELEAEESALRNQKSLIDVLVKTFSTSGLVAYKIECLVKDLEDLTNKYLAEFSDGRFQITFQLNGSDKLNVIITDNGNDVEIAELSNGERARVNISALLAIRKLLQSLSSNQTNLLFLDEVIENLDVHGKEKLIEVLLEETHLNTILVSHAFTHPLLEKVQVVKENNISRIE